MTTFDRRKLQRNFRLPTRPSRQTPYFLLQLLTQKREENVALPERLLYAMSRKAIPGMKGKSPYIKLFRKDTSCDWLNSLLQLAQITCIPDRNSTVVMPINLSSSGVASSKSSRLLSNNRNLGDCESLWMAKSSNRLCPKFTKHPALRRTWPIQPSKWLYE